MKLKYAIVPYPIPEVILKTGLISQTNSSARVNNSKTSCVVSFQPTFESDLSKYPNFDTAESLASFLDKNQEEWDADKKINEKFDSEGRLVITPGPFSETGDFFFRGKGFVGTADKSVDGTTPKVTNIDHKLTADRHINGVRLILKNQSWDDSVYFEIVDEDFDFAGILYPATPLEYGIPVPEGIPWSAIMPDGMILNRFGEDWQISESEDQGRELLKYPAALKKDMTVRIVYKTYSTEDVKVKCNLYLHEKK